MIEFNKEKRLKLVKKLKNVMFRRQDAPIVYEMNASIYFEKKYYLKAIICLEKILVFT